MQTSKHILMLLTVTAAWGCGEGSGSTVGKFTRDASLPLYFSVSGARFGQGAVYRINELARGGVSEPELVVGGLNFPAGIAMDSAGYLYIAEKLPTPLGTVKVVPPGGDTAEILIEGLHNPVSVGVDTFNRLYVVEGDLGRIQKADATGAMAPFKNTDLDGPRDLFVDSGDNVYVTETESGAVTKISPKGDAEVLTQGLVNPFGLTADLAGEIYVLVNNTGVNDGEIQKLAPGGEPELLVGGLFNPIAVTCDNANGLFFIEGTPANRIVAYSLKSGELNVVADGLASPYSIILTPR